MVEGQTGRQTLLLRRDVPARHALVFQPVNAVRARRAAALIGLPVWISLRRTRPVSEQWGFDRGTPVDRFYFDDFV
jgi:hypothetical protein